MYHFLENAVTKISHLDVHTVWQTKDLETTTKKANSKYLQCEIDFKNQTYKYN